MEIEERRIYIGGMLFGWEEDFNKLLIKILEHHRIKISFYGNKKYKEYKSDGRKVRGSSLEYIIDNSVIYEPSNYQIKILHIRDVRDIVSEMLDNDPSFMNRDYRMIASFILNRHDIRAKFTPDLVIKYEEGITTEMMDKLITLLMIHRKNLDFSFVKNAVDEFNSINRNIGGFTSKIPIEGIRSIQSKYGDWLGERDYSII